MKKGYRKKLDYLRLFSCAAVFLYHLGILKGGYLAVCSFFVLSGYLAVRSFQKKDISLKSYYLGRLKNIYLPLLIVTLTSVGLVSLSGKTWINLKPETTSVLLGYNNFWQIGAETDYFTRHSDSPFMHMWYIAILLQFDLIFPFIYIGLRMASKKVSKILPYLILSLLSVGSLICFTILLTKGQVMSAYYGTFSRSFSLFLGVMCGFYQIRHEAPVSKNSQINEIGFYVYLAVMLLMDLTIASDSSLMIMGMILTSLFSVRAIDLAVSDRSKNRRDPIIKLLSGMSYGIYLFQYPVIFLLQDMKVPVFLKDLLIILITVILSFLLYEALQKKKQVLQIVCCAAFVISTLLGGYKFVTAKDYSEEIEDLQNKLEENQQLIEEKNEEYLEKREEEETQPVIDPSLSADEAVAEMLKNMRVTGVGDSLMIDVAEDLYERFPNGYFDGEISRHQEVGTAIMEDLKESGNLSDTIILMLAANGDYIERYNVEMMEVVGDREVFWVNTPGCYDPEFNDRFEVFARDYDNLHIVDWVSYSNDHPEYFYYDGLHVMEEGTAALADLIYEEIYDFYMDRYLKGKLN